MKKIFLVASIVILAVVLILTGCAQPGQTTTPTQPTGTGPIELKFSYWPPPSDKWVINGVLPWGAEVEKRAPGKVKVTYYGGAQLGAPPDHLDLVMKGTADIGWINPAFTPSVFPLTDIRNMPFLYPSVQVAAKVFWRQQEEILNELEYKNKIKVLFTFATPTMECSMRTKQIKTMEDLKGLKFGDTEAWAGKTSAALGAVPQIMMEPDIYTSLQTGLLDGRWQEYNGLITWRTVEVTKFRTDNIRIFVHQNLMGMNLAKYNSLPADVKKAIDDMSGFNYSAKTGDIWNQAEQDSKAEVLAQDKARGYPEPYLLPDAERARWVTAAQPVIDEWIKEMDGKGLGAHARNLYEKTKQWVAEYSK